MFSDPWLHRWMPLVVERSDDTPVLEIGCGYGDDTVTLRKAGLNVLAFDLSPLCIAAAKLRAPGAHNGQGYAAEAVRQVVHKAFGELKLLRIEACANHQNHGSIAVLQRNGFTQFGRSTRSFCLRGIWHDLLHFECHAPPATPN